MSSDSFEIIPGASGSSVILHVPHASRHIPADVREGIVLDDVELEAELDAMTDADTDRLAERAAEMARVRPWIFVHRASRLVVDPERFPDEREEMNAVGMGAVYERTSRGERLRAPSATERAALIDSFFTPYAEALAGLVRELLDVVGGVTIIDVHSYPRDALPYELHAEGSRPEVCIGTDPFHTPGSLRDLAVATMRGAAPSHDVGIDTPFAGCYVPLDQYKRTPCVRAVMLEIRRDVVAAHLDALARGVGALVDAIDHSATLDPSEGST
jgi:N-formylglutamate deformylase